MKIAGSKRYAERRERLMDAIGDGLILVRGQGPDGTNPSFVYLTGIDEPGAALLLAPEGTRIRAGRAQPGRDYVAGQIARSVLFLPPWNALAARWGEGPAATVRDVEARDAAVDLVRDATTLDTTLTPCLQDADALHVVRATLPVLSGEDDPDTIFADRIRRRFLALRVTDATETVHGMRSAKDASEVEAIERSIGVTGEALRRVVEVVRPGMCEHDLEAEIARVYRSHGGIHAFDPIVAAAGSALLLHYRDNSGPVEDGALVLVDTGVSIDGYKSDITRTYPVNGKFDARQREVYDAVLRAQERAICVCKPGALIGEIHAAAYDALAEAGFADAFPHGTAHHLGLETHDVGDIQRPLEPGAVVTVEPGVYLSDERIGVRIEDDVLITDDGHRVLSAAIPKSTEAIEAAMAARSGRGR